MFNFSSINIDKYFNYLITNNKYSKKELSVDGIHGTDLGNKLISKYIIENNKLLFKNNVLKYTNFFDNKLYELIPNDILSIENQLTNSISNIFHSTLLNHDIKYNILYEGKYKFKFENYMLTSIALLMDCNTIMKIIINNKIYYSFNKELPISIINDKTFIIEINLGNYIKKNEELNIEIIKYNNLDSFDFCNNSFLYNSNKDIIIKKCNSSQNYVKIIGFIGILV